MSDKQDEQTEIMAANERLKRFTKPVVNYHDPERLAAAKEGQKYVPRSVWRELGRKFQLI